MDAFWQQKAIVLVQRLNEISVIAPLLGLPLSSVCLPPAQLSTFLEASEPSDGFWRQRETHFPSPGKI